MTFTEHDGVIAMNPEEGTSSGGKGIDVSICLEEERKLIWMRDTKTRLLMQMKLMVCREESDCLIRCCDCAVNNYPKDHCPPMLLPVAHGYHKKMCEREQTAVKGILPLVLKMVFKIHYPHCQLNTSRRHHRHLTFHHPRHRSRVLSLSR